MQELLVSTRSAVRGISYKVMELKRIFYGSGHKSLLRSLFENARNFVARSFASFVRQINQTSREPNSELPLDNESITSEAKSYSPSKIDPSHTAVRLDAERVVSAVQIADITVDRRKWGLDTLESDR